MVSKETHTILCRNRIVRNKFPYTRVPVDPAIDLTRPIFKAESVFWEPLLRVRIGIPKGKRGPRFRAYVDSGSPWCLFKSALGQFLGLDVESGEKDEVGGIVEGPVQPVYFHRLTLFIEDHWIIPVRAGFVKKLSADGILGRDGFFDNFRIGFDHTDKPPHFVLDKIERSQ